MGPMASYVTAINMKVLAKSLSSDKDGRRLFLHKCNKTRNKAVTYDHGCDCLKQRYITISVLRRDFSEGTFYVGEDRLISFKFCYFSEFAELHFSSRKSICICFG